MRSRRTIEAGFTLAMVMGMLCGLEWLMANRFPQMDGITKGWVALLAQTIIFGAPALFLYCREKKHGEINLRFRRLPLKWLPFVAECALAASLLSFFLNYAAAVLWKRSDMTGGDSVLGGVWLLLAASVLAPAFFEELYLRGALFSLYEECGTKTAIIFTALVFAMTHGSLRNFAGPFAAGIAYAYLVFVTGSIFASVLAHLLNNLLAAVMDRVLLFYGVCGKWSYFFILSALLFFVFGALALRTLEKLVSKGETPGFRPAQEGALSAVFATLLSPGFMIFAALYAMKLMLG